MSERKAVVLDFDGTVADTMKGLQQVGVQIFVDTYGLSLAEAREQFLETAGEPFAAQLEILFPGHRLNPGSAGRFHERKLSVFTAASPFSDTRKALELLAHYGVISGIVSSTESALLEGFINRHGLRDLAGALFGMTSGDDSKEMQVGRFKATLHLLGPEVTLIGDTPRDAECALRSGVGILAVTTTFTKDVFDRKVIPSVPSLLAAVERVVYA